MYFVILAGGGGTRLWPLSTPERPKPFLPLLGDRTLIQLTVDRLLGGSEAGGSELGAVAGDITIVTDRRYADLCRAQLPGVRTIGEPVGRNTGPAVALAEAAIDRPDDEVMIVLPADHRIRDEVGFRAVLAGAAAAAAEPGALVTLGIAPTGPETGYGYIVADGRSRSVGGVSVQGVERFVEKPPRDRALELIAGPRQASWNAGIFAWRRDSIRAALTAFAADVATEVGNGWRSGDLAGAYDRVRSASIDYAVMEPASVAGLVRVTQADVGWSDLGSWTALLDALGGTAAGRVIQAGDSAAAGADDLIVERIDGRLCLADGPRGILQPMPSALLVGARSARSIVEALLDRVSRQEMHA